MGTIYLLSAREPPSVPPEEGEAQSGRILLRALRWPFGLPFGREHFVVITDLER